MVWKAGVGHHGGMQGDDGMNAGGVPPPFQVMVKPTGPICNLDCTYCYYTEKKALYPKERRFAMKEEVLETLIRDYLAAGRDWHVGTIGIVASRLVSRYRRPAIVIALDGEGGGRGSGRSIEGVDLVSILDACEDLLETHGGHEMAAGLNIREDKVAAFRERFNQLCSDQLKGADLRAVQRVDAWISLGEVDRELYDQSLRLGPFGMGNPKPVWGARHVQVAGNPRRVGKEGAHLKLLLAAGRTQLDAIGFGLGPCDLPVDPIDILFEIAEDTYRGHGQLQLILKDLAPSA